MQTEQQKRDFEAINAIWSILRDSDPTVMPDPHERWHEIMEVRGEDIRRKYPEFTNVVAYILNMIIEREKRGQK